MVLKVNYIYIYIYVLESPLPSRLRTPTKINDSTLAVGAIQGQMENSLKQNTLKIMVSPSIMNSCNDSHIYWNAFTAIHKTPK